jgi:hypothetical protein
LRKAINWSESPAVKAAAIESPLAPGRTQSQYTRHIRDNAGQRGVLAGVGLTEMHQFGGTTVEVERADLECRFALARVEVAEGDEVVGQRQQVAHVARQAFEIAHGLGLGLAGRRAWRPAMRCKRQAGPAAPASRFRSARRGRRAKAPPRLRGTRRWTPPTPD